MTLPALVLVHGSFHRKEMWNALIEELPDVDIRTIQLPSSAPVPVDQLGSMYEDAQAVKDLALAVDGPVVVCAHSYGGVPVSEGLAGISTVKHIVYLNSFLLDIGESMLGNRGGIYPPHWGVHEREQYVEMIGAEKVFYNDLSRRDAERAAGALGPQSLLSMQQPLTRAAWHDTASTYVIGERDAGLPVPMREKFAARSGNVRRIDTSHSPFYSRPAETAALLREALTGKLTQTSGRQ
ncbi:alpha/beta hydrolase [Streptomyces sp. NPDC046870]|uniref:alpha/beta hydrolase n=1 Tax=Streptomyces sp. NPDC046870 TaxID=3155135 RepID=UPI003455364C